MNSASHSRNVSTHQILVAITLLAVAAVVWTVADAVVITFGGIVIATILLSLSLPLSRATGWAKRWCLLVVVAGLFGIFGLFSWLFGNELGNEIAQFQEQIPAAWQKLKTWLDASPAGRAMLHSFMQSGVNKEMLTQASSVFSAVLGATGNLLLIIFLGIYFASDPELYRDGAVRLVPVHRRKQVRRTLDHTGIALRKWLVAQVVAMVVVGLLTGTALAVMGVPLALSLGILAGLLEFVPVVGPIISAVPGVLLAFSLGPHMAMYVALAYTVVQQIESNVITPVLQRWAVKLPPVIGLVAIVVCGLLFGVLGVVFAMPIAVVAMVLVKELYVEDTLEKTVPEESAAPSSS